MRRDTSQDRKRTRNLSDDELRKVWGAAEADGDVYGAFVRMSLLTGQRSAKTSRYALDGRSEDGVWTIPTAPREKGPRRAAVAAVAMKIIKARPHIASNPYVFAGRFNGPLSGFS